MIYGIHEDLHPSIIIVLSLISVNCLLRSTTGLKQRPR